MVNNVSALPRPVYYILGSRYVTFVLVALDQLANALLGGYPRETISSRAAKGARRGNKGWCLLCKVLDLFQRNHCELVIELDQGETDADNLPAPRETF
jgi:hypothetical protein